MKYKKNIPNLIRSKLLSFINNEVIENFKKEQQIRINSKKIIDIYNNYNQNYEIYLQKKIIRSNLKVYDYSTTKLKRNSLIFFPLDDLSEIEKEKDLKYLHYIQNKKVLFSQKKLKTVHYQSNNLKSNDKMSFKIQDSVKDNLLKLRKISNDIINTKIILEKFKQINDKSKSPNVERHHNTRKKVKNLTFNIENEFKINLKICKRLGNESLFNDENQEDNCAYRNYNKYVNNYNKRNKEDSNIRRKKKNNSYYHNDTTYIKDCLNNNIEVN